MKLPFDDWTFSLRLIAAVAAVGAINVLLLPWETSDALVREGGLIEIATVLFYYLALMVIWLGTPDLDRVSRVAISLLLLACVAREMDLHSALFGVSILKSNFYRHYATPAQIAGALAIIFPVLLSIGFLLKRHGRWLLDGVRRRRPVQVTIFSIMLTLVVAKLLDRLLAFAAPFGGEGARLVARAIQLPLEEPLESLLPLLVIVAVVQHWRTGETRQRNAAAEMRKQAQAED